MSNERIVDIADLDVIYLTYDEPQKERFWIQIQNLVPWAKRVDGVKGSDAAHKAAAAASDTERFVLIDGDNIPDAEFFNLQLHLNDFNKDNVFRWKARNEINGLMYGNGGLSCWTKTFVNNMRTHEASDGSDDTSVEFCFDPRYVAMHNCYSTTYPNGSAKQAWRAGFREGVKMCLDRGAKPSLKEFEDKVHKRNFDHLCIWQSVGRDVPFGEWAILGARLGTYLTMFGDANGSPFTDYKLVQDFEILNATFDFYYEFHKNDVATAIETLGFALKQQLSLPIVELDTEQSKFFKHHYAASHKNLHMMTSELEVIRKVEQW